MSHLIKLVILSLVTCALVSADYEEYYEDDYEAYDSEYDRDGDSGSAINPLAAFLAPLAGLALLGAAAAVSINPVLVQLAVINGGRRKRRHVLQPPATVQKKIGEIELLETFLSKQPDFEAQSENMVAQYLQCSGLSSTKNQVSHLHAAELYWATRSNP